MDFDPDEIIAIYRKRLGDRAAVQTNEAKLSSEILLRRERQCHLDTDMGDADSQFAAYGDAERADTAVELLKLATMVRITLMYYVDFYSLFINPEKEWEILLGKVSDAPPQPSLFD